MIGNFESSLEPAIHWMKLMGIQMNVSGKDRFISRFLVGVIGISISCINLYLWEIPLTEAHGAESNMEGTLENECGGKLSYNILNVYFQQKYEVLNCY